MGQLIDLAFCHSDWPCLVFNDVFIPTLFDNMHDKLSYIAEKTIAVYGKWISLYLLLVKGNNLLRDELEKKKIFEDRSYDLVIKLW